MMVSSSYDSLAKLNNAENGAEEFLTSRLKAREEMLYYLRLKTACPNWYEYVRPFACKLLKAFELNKGSTFDYNYCGGAVFEPYIIALCVATGLEGKSDVFEAGIDKFNAGYKLEDKNWWGIKELINTKYSEAFAGIFASPAETNKFLKFDSYDNSTCTEGLTIDQFISKRLKESEKILRDGLERLAETDFGTESLNKAFFVMVRANFFMRRTCNYPFPSSCVGAYLDHLCGFDKQ